MARLSPKARRQAHTRRENSLLRRDIMNLNRAVIKANGLILAMLMQEDGDTTLRADTLQRLAIEGPALGYQLTAHENGNLTISMAVADPAMLEQIRAEVRHAEELAAQDAAPAAPRGIILTDGDPRA